MDHISEGNLKAIFFKKRMMRKLIGFDITNKERGRIFDNYIEVRDILERIDFSCKEYDEYPISEGTIEKFDVMIFACPDNSKFGLNELNVLSEFVNSGKCLLLLSHAGGDKGRRSNLSALSEIFGIRFNNDQVFDDVNNLDLESFPLVETYSDYYIDEKIPPICHRIGCSLEIINHSVLPLAMTRSTAVPDNAVTASLSYYGKGKVICVGSYEMFRDEVKGGISYSPNQEFFKFIIEILVSRNFNRDVNKVSLETYSKSRLRKLDKNGSSKGSKNDANTGPKNKANNEFKNESINDPQKFTQTQIEDLEIIKEFKSKFQEFQEQVYLILKEQQSKSDELFREFEKVQTSINIIKEAQFKLEKDLNELYEKVLNFEIGIPVGDNNRYNFSSNLDLLQDSLTEFKLEADFINKKLVELEKEQTRLNKIMNELLSRKQKYLCGDELEEFNYRPAVNNDIVFIKASDLTKRRSPHTSSINSNTANDHNENRTSDNYDSKIKYFITTTPQNQNVIDSQDSKDEKILQIKKFLNFLKKQYEIGVLDYEEYLLKKEKIECKINNID